MILHIKALGLVFSDKKIVSCFHYKSQCKACDPHSLNNFGEVPQGDATIA